MPERPVKSSEPSATVRGYEVINRRFFYPAIWKLKLSTETGPAQYSKFVDVMMGRIRSNTSSYDEIESFAHLVAMEHSPDFMTVTIPYLWELKEQFPYDTKRFETALLFLLLGCEICRKDIDEVQIAKAISTTYEIGLSKTEERILEYRLFGPDRGAVDSPSMKRLFKSTLELGYPQPALDQLMRDAEARGTDIECSSDGLPSNLRMPTAGSRPGENPSSTSNHGTGTTGASSPSNSAKPPRVRWSSAVEANEPRESALRDFLTELAIDGADPPVLIADIETSPQAESPNSPQEPSHGPPGIRRSTAEREEFKAYHKASDDEFLNYFKSREPMSYPDMSAPSPTPAFSDPVVISRPSRASSTAENTGLAESENPLDEEDWEDWEEIKRERKS